MTMRMFAAVLLGGLLLAAPARCDDLQCAVAVLLSQPPTATELPLCGNGVVDPGEVCDDGNRLGGDGCNAWCTQFDLMTRACTVAGTGATCAPSGPVLDAPALTTFCSLTAISVSPDSTYAVLADGGALLRMPLFAAPTEPVTRMRATTDLGSFTRFCSVFALPDGSTLAHECALQQVFLFSPDGANYQLLATLDTLAPAAQGGAWYDAAAGELIVAGVPVIATPATCARVYAVNVTGGSRLAGSVPCEVYNVWESGTIYTSFSVQGMAPYEVAQGACLLQMAAAVCYVVSMVRDDMQTMQAYLPRAGGDDLYYTVSTDATVNVLGAPMHVVSADGAVDYTATGGCFAAQARSPAAGGRVAPRVALGSACAVASAPSCWTPFNSPFNTDVLASPYTLPAGLSARHTHAQLVTIFSVSASTIAAQLGAASGVLLSGMPLYRQILQNAYAGTAPVAFAEIPATRDVLYITAGTVGLIGAKGIVVNDIYNPGYCMATSAIQCPAGAFGNVGGGCRDCATEDDGSPAAQVQCLGVQSATRRRRLLSAGQSPPTLQMSSIVTKDVTQEIIDTAVAFYLMSKGFPCPALDSTTITPHQAYNMDADALDSGAPTQNLTTMLIEAATQATGVQHDVPNSAEYIVTWTAQSLDMLQAASAAPAMPLPVADADFAPCASIKPIPRGIASNMTAACAGILNRRFDQRMLQCLVAAAAAAAGNAAGNATTSGGRRLMQTAAVQTAYATPASMFTFVANTPIDFSAPAPAPPPPPPAPAPAQSTQGAAIWTIVAGALGGAAGLAVVIVALYLGFLQHAPDAGAYHKAV